MLFRLLVRYLRPYWALLLAVVVFQSLQSWAMLALPSLNADIIDLGIATGDTGYILSTGAWMLLITLAQIVCTVVAVYFGARAAMSLGRDLRRDVFRGVGAFSEREVNTFGAPSLITRSTNDVQQVQTLVQMICTMLVSAPILAIGGVIAAMRLNLELSWLIAVSVPVLVVLVLLVVTRMLPLYRLVQQRIDRVNLVLREQLTGIRVIRAFVREPIETKRFDVVNTEITDVTTRAGRLMVLIPPLVMAVLNVSSVAVLWFGAFRVADGSLEIGTLFAFLQYLMQILMAVMMSTFMLVMVPRASVSADRIGEVLETESSVTPPAVPVTVLRAHGTIELQNVSFSYPGADQPVLRNLSFTLQPGTTTAVVGSTGAGKTTLVNLMLRLFDATEGRVLVDGVDVRDLDPKLLWSRIGLVPQKPYLFAGTIASNLRYGNPDATDDELWRALETAQARDFVAAMPGGLSAKIAQGGTNVSGGQRQRLAIARAIVKRPEIYVFDDSFSALDVATDARLRRALDRDVGGATRFVVAQRVTSIVSADQILVLEHGVIVARGTHEELLSNSEIYAEIVASQLKAEEVAA